MKMYVPGFHEKQDVKLLSLLSTIFRHTRQKRILSWAQDVFGEAALSPDERMRRFFEEAVELAQAHGLDKKAALNLVTYVYSRPKGRVAQEVGGVSITLLSYCESVGISADLAEIVEFDRALSLDKDKLRAKQNSKADAGVAQRVP